MTNEQLNHYEALDNMVNLEFDELTDRILELATMHIHEGESSSAYLQRVKDQTAAVDAQKQMLEDARKAKREFLKSV